MGFDAAPRQMDEQGRSMHLRYRDGMASECATGPLPYQKNREGADRAADKNCRPNMYVPLEHHQPRKHAIGPLLNLVLRLLKQRRRSLALGD